MAKQTYPRVVELLNECIPAKITRNEFCRVTGINRNSVDRYRAGLGCPTNETLHKLADYFKVSVAYLRGEETDVIIRLLRHQYKDLEMALSTCKEDPENKKRDKRNFDQVRKLGAFARACNVYDDPNLKADIERNLKIVSEILLYEDL